MAEQDHAIERAPFIEAPALKKYSLHIRHGFFGRKGGVSTGIYNSLNCGPGSKDDLTKVIENRRRVCVSMGGEAGRLATLYQVHSPTAVTVTDPFAPGQAPQADALVTDRPGLILGVLAADCAPILLCDAHNGVIGAAHAGWKGAVAGVLESCVEAMIKLGADPSRMAAAVGPCLAQFSFEVGPDLVEAVLEASPWAEHLFIPGMDDRRQFDLKGYCLARLVRMGVSHADALADDTLTQPDLYFSNRFTVKAGAGDYGRNISTVMLLA
jgi:YfiH family protein